MDPIGEAARYIRLNPPDASDLYLQPRHRSEEMTPNVRILQTGLVGYFPYDWQLVTTLLMRWRPETHTFYMAVGIGETMITLEDIAIHLGLPIDGRKGEQFPLDAGSGGDESAEELYQMGSIVGALQLWPSCFARCARRQGGLRSHRWSDYRVTATESCMHNVTEYLSKMNNMSAARAYRPLSSVNWQPHAHLIRNGDIHDYCLRKIELGRAHVPLL
ncbi:Serine/threonine-protein phosphatase 7 long form-like [Senna tora]|uniref:Serine/threonine-protein phosphatase 7 long form-like n=1 Tax=Senna tora TaxID=362788 RepID=A0A834TH62_9FABA|nr:Serine/threonine-protein phosphatase 7 long form-like [Senna tora]